MCLLLVTRRIWGPSKGVCQLWVTRAIYINIYMAVRGLPLAQLGADQHLLPPSAGGGGFTFCRDLLPKLFEAQYLINSSSN